MEPALREVEQQISAFEARLTAQAAALDATREEERAADAALRDARAALVAPKRENLRAQQILAAAYLRVHQTEAAAEARVAAVKLEAGEKGAEAGEEVTPARVAGLRRLAVLAGEAEASVNSWKSTAKELRAEREAREGRTRRLRELAQRLDNAMPAIRRAGAAAAADAHQLENDMAREATLKRRLHQQVEDRKEELRLLSQRLGATEKRIATAEAALAGARG